MSGHGHSHGGQPCHGHGHGGSGPASPQAVGAEAAQLSQAQMMELMRKQLEAQAVQSQPQRPADLTVFQLCQRGMLAELQVRGTSPVRRRQWL